MVAADIAATFIWASGLFIGAGCAILFIGGMIAGYLWIIDDV